MKRFTFKVELSGLGKTCEEAWNDATEQFAMEPGPAPSEVMTDEVSSIKVCPECYSEDVVTNVRQGEGQAFGAPAHIVDMGFKCNSCQAEWGFEKFKKEGDADV